MEDAATFRRADMYWARNRALIVYAVYLLYGVVLWTRGVRID